MPGSLQIENARGRWSKSVAARRAFAYLLAVLVGAAAGLLVAQTRLHLGLPGHKALFWMIPVVAVRLLVPASAGAIAGSLSAVSVAFLCGGQFAGPLPFLPLIVLAGALLDAAAGRANFPARAWRTLALMGTAGLAANLICMVHRLFNPLALMSGVVNGVRVRDLICYSGFGLVAGLVGAALAMGARAASSAAGGRRAPK